MNTQIFIYHPNVYILPIIPKFYWDKIKRIAPSLNIQLGEPKWFEVADSRVTSYSSVIEKSVVGLTPDITVVMIPKVDGEMYSTLKKLMTCRYVQ